MPISRNNGLKFSVSVYKDLKTLITVFVELSIRTKDQFEFWKNNLKKSVFYKNVNCQYFFIDN